MKKVEIQHNATGTIVDTLVHFSIDTAATSIAAAAAQRIIMWNLPPEEYSVNIYDAAGNVESLPLF